MRITVKQVQESRKYALHCYKQYAIADEQKQLNSPQMFNEYWKAFEDYQKLDIQLFEQQMVK